MRLTRRPDARPGFHEDFSRTGHGRGATDRSFGIVFAIMFVVIALWPLARHGGVRIWAFCVAGAFLAAAFSRPSVLHPLNRVWTAFALLLNRIVAPVAMGAMFFLVITPVAVIRRLLGKDPLRLRADPDASTYWIPRPPRGQEQGTMENQF